MDLNYGKALVEKNRRPGDVPVYGTNGRCGWHDEPLAAGPTVILGRKGMGNLGVEWCDRDFWVIDTAYYVTPRTGGIDLKFFYYLIDYIGLNHLKDGTSNPSLSRDTFAVQLLPCPPLADQKAIAEILSSLDDKIELNRRMNGTMEAMARAIFRAWFVDFEPVRAKAAGARSFPGIPHKAFEALPTRLAESELGPIPEGWGAGCLGDNCEINALSVRKGAIEGEIEYVDISSVTIGHLDAVEVTPFVDAPSRARRRVRHGDTIWSCVRPNHRSYLFIHSPPENRVVSTGFAVLSPRTFGPSLLYQMTIQPEFVDYLVSNADGSAYPAVRPDHFARAEVIVPPSASRDSFEAITMPCRDRIAAFDRESRELAAMRDYLLPKLLSGEVRVADAEKRATRKEHVHP